VGIESSWNFSTLGAERLRLFGQISEILVGLLLGFGTHWGISDGLTQQGTVIGFVGVLKC